MKQYWWPVLKVKNTSAAPGLNPFKISAAAMGVEEVAQMYMGTPATSITSMDKYRLPR